MTKKVNRADKATRNAAYRRVLRLIKPYGFWVVLSILTSAVAVFAQLYIPILAGEAIDYMIDVGCVDFSGITAVLIKIALSIAAAALTLLLSGLCNNKIAYSISRDLRDSAIKKIQVLPLSYLDSHPTGDLLSRIIADVDLFSDGLLMGFTNFFSGILTIIGTLALWYPSICPSHSSWYALRR